jgi:diaminopimelate epimerase
VALDWLVARTLVLMRFAKAHGTGNDFVVVADLDGKLDLSPALVRALTDRRFGVGADGVLRIGPPMADGAVFMDYRNADGSVVEMCGNGVRVVAKHVLDHGLVDSSADTIAIETRAGTKHVQVRRGSDGRVETVTVDMGPPDFDPRNVPFLADDADALIHGVEVNGHTVDVAVVSMGNPHAVIEVSDVGSADVGGLGATLEKHERFPRHANVGFVAPRDRGSIDLRVWERGVGETAACGTGACAAVAALSRRGLLDREVRVRMPGGELRVELTGSTILMTGPAVEVAHGEIDTSWLQAHEGRT